jgi:alkaline phosphatase
MKKGKNVSRLEFLKTGLLTAGAIGTGVAGSGITGSRAGSGAGGAGVMSNRRAGEAKNVIFLVSDGMSSGTLTLAELVKQGKMGAPTHWMNMYASDPSGLAGVSGGVGSSCASGVNGAAGGVGKPYHRGLMDMASLSSLVTDSAAAASSWGCGHRINNGGVNWGPNNEQYKPVLEIFRDAGRATGLVTTTRITHATPAGFSANVPSRNMENEIAVQYLEREFDLLMGGGRRHFTEERRPDKRNLLQEFEQKGYKVALSKSEMEGATGENATGKLLGLFYDSHLPYTVDHQSLPELQNSVPTLAEMTSVALQRLSDSGKDGFILQIEGGRVDHAAHGNDAAGLIYDQIAFDDAIKVVMDFTENRDDTLVILTTDHANANPGLVGLGSSYSQSNDMLKTIFEARHSMEWMFEEMDYSWSDGVLTGLKVKQILDLIEYTTRIQLANEEALMIKRAFEGTLEVPFRNRQGPGAVIGSVLANYNGVNFLSTNHTSDFVELAAWGPGSEGLPGITRNTDLFDLMVTMAGVGEFAE